MNHWVVVLLSIQAYLRAAIMTLYEGPRTHRVVHIIAVEAKGLWQRLACPEGKTFNSFLACPGEGFASFCTFLTRV